MNKLVNFLKTYLNEIVFSLSFIAVLCAMACPFADITLSDGSTLSISFVEALAGGSLTIGGQVYTLTGTSILLIFGYQTDVNL